MLRSGRKPRDLSERMIFNNYRAMQHLRSLRDAPLTNAGKRKAILHWVTKHTRATRQERVNVSEHWRGTRTLSIDGLRVTLAPNVGIEPPRSGRLE